MSEKYYLDTDGLITKNCGWGAIAKFGGEHAVIDELNALQARVEELEKSISKAVIDAKLWRDRYKQEKENDIAMGLDIVLDILRKHGLIGGE